MNIGDIFLRLLADDGDFAKDVEKKAAAAGSQAGQSLGQRMGQQATKALTGLGAAGGVLFASAIEGATTFEDQLRTINTVAKLTDEQLFAIGDEIQALSRETGKSTDDLTAGFYDLVSAGVPAGEAMGVLKDSAILATGALGTTGESVDLVTSVLGAYNKEASESTRSTNIWAQAVADGKTTVSELAQSIGTVAPIAAALGVEEEELAAATALVTLSGASASEAMTQAKNAMNALLKPNAKLNELQEDTGKNFAEIAREKGLAVALEEIRVAVNGDNAAMSAVLGSSEALNFAFQVTGDNAGAMATELGRIEAGADQGTVAIGQYTEKSKSGAEQGKRMAATINTLLQDFGGLASGMGPVLFAMNEFGRILPISPAKLFGGVIGGLTGKVLPKFAGALKGLGPAVGRLIFPATAFAGPLETALAEGLTDAPKSGKVKAAAGKLGKFLGSGLGKLAAGAFSAFLLVEVVNTYNRIKGELAGQLEGIGQGIAKQITTGTTEELERSRKATADALSKLMSMPDFGLISGDAKDQLKKELDAINAELVRRASGLGPATGSALASGEGAVTDGAEDMLSGIVPELDDTAAAAGKAAQQTPQEIADSIRSKRDAVDQAMSALTDAMENEMTRAQERVKVIAALTGEDLAKGLKSKDPVVRAQADATREILEGRLRELANRSGEHGRKTGDLLVKGLKSKDPDVRAAAVRTRGILEEQFRNSQRAASRYGWNTADAYADGIRSGYTKVKNAAIYLVQGAKEVLRAYSPPGPDSPLHDIDVWGEKTGTAWADGMVAAITGSTRRIRGAVGATSAAFGLTPPTSSFAAPSVARMSVPDAMLGDASLAGGDTYNIPVHVQGALPVETIRDIQSGIRRVGEAGLLPKRTAPAQYPIRRG